MFRNRFSLPSVSLPGYLWMPTLFVIGIALSWLFGTGQIDRLLLFSRGLVSVVFWLTVFFLPWFLGFCTNRWLRRSPRGARIDGNIRDQLERIPYIGSRVHGLHWLIVAGMMSWGVYEATYALVDLTRELPLFYVGRWFFWESTSMHAQSAVAGTLCLFAMLVEPLIISWETWWREDDKFSVPLTALRQGSTLAAKSAKQVYAVSQKIPKQMPPMARPKWFPKRGELQLATEQAGESQNE